MLYFKARISFTYTMVWFGVLAFFWIKNEIAYGTHNPPWRLLASAGARSYLLYLTHGPAAELFGMFSNPNVNSILGWCALYAVILALAYMFYLLVERPSHQMARRIALVKKSVPLAVKEEALPSFPV
jgi:peptidoglycan/LPS O-acetylase OafA/YrhL